MAPTVFSRFNEPAPRPNPLINFIRALPDLHDTSEAVRFLERLAAEVYPVMVKFGLKVGTFQEVSSYNPSQYWFTLF